MELKECLNTIEKVCAAYTGNLQEHQVIQTSLATIKSALQGQMSEELVNEPQEPEEDKAKE